jgi:cell division protein FtsL
VSLPAERTPVAAEPARRTPSRPGTVPPAHRAAPLPKREAPAGSRAATSSAKRRKHHLGFFVFSAFVVSSMILAIVTLNVLLAQTSFRMDAAQERIDRLTQEQVDLVRHQAALSAPRRIAAWARRHDMRLPDDIRFLHVPSTQAVPAGGAGISPEAAP